MTDTRSAVESTAIRILTRAVDLDSKAKYADALVCYQEGIQLLMELLRGINDVSKRDDLRQRIARYMERAEKVKVFVDKDKDSGKYHEEIQIEDNATGYDYERLFSRLLDDTVEVVLIEDPYILVNHQIYNFLRFCEMLVKHCSNLKKINLITSSDKKHEEEKKQRSRLDLIAKSLSERRIELNIEYSKTLHDRVVRLSNGWILSIGRGLDIYKSVDNCYSIGFCDFSLRPCHETTIHIYHSKYTKLS